MPQNKDATLGILTDKVGRLACQKCGEELDVTEYSIFEHVLCPVCQNELSVPAKLGNFLLLDEIGKGGMGAVYLAKDESLGRDVALKVMRQEYGNDPRFLDRLLKEAQAAASLNHPNVVQVYTFGQEMGQPYIVMELVNGGRLDLHMKRTPQVDELVVLDTALDVAKGLQAAADVGLIHGDIKPANILYDRQNHAKVVDFGLAKFEGGAKTKGEIWGTPYYIAPEKARGKSEDSRSDQYSLGATLYHALTGKPPFDGESAADVVVARLKTPPPEVRQLAPGVSEKTAALVLRMMDQQPARRYPTYPSLLADLHAARQDLVAARQQGAAKGKAGAKASAKGSGLVWVVAGVVAAAAVAAGILLSGPGQQDKHPVPNGGSARPGTPVGSKPVNSWTGHQPNDSSPFTRAESQALIEAIELVAGPLAKGEPPRSLGAMAKIGAVMVKHKDASSPGYAWGLLYQSLIHILCNEGDAAVSSIKELLGAKINFVSPSTEEDPRVLAKLLGGQVTLAAVKANIAGAEPWFQRLAEFCGAYRMVLGGEADPVVAPLQAYAAMPHDAFWPFAFQGFARELARQAGELSGLLKITDEKTKADKLAAFAARYPAWKPGVQKIAGNLPLTRAGRSYREVAKSLKPIAHYALDEKSPGRLQADPDPQQAASATYVVADGLGKSNGALGAAEGHQAGNLYLNLAERNSFDYVNNLIASGKLSMREGGVAFWFRTREKGDREMFFARAADGTPLRIRLDGSGKPGVEAGEQASGGRVQAAVDAADGKWRLVVASWNRDGNKLTLSVDGAVTSGPLKLPDSPISLARFGRSDQGGAQFKGDLDELTLWDRELSPAEIGLLGSK